MQRKPALKIINLAKEIRKSGVLAKLPQGTSQQLPNRRAVA